MALFGLNKKKKDEQKKSPPTKRVEKETAPKIVTTPRTAPSGVSASQVLLRPHTTEKAAQLTASNIYTFEVSRRATKKSVTDAIVSLYKVSPVKVALATIPKKRVRLRTRRGWGTKGGLKKAYVYLKKGDRIELAS